MPVRHQDRYCSLRHRSGWSSPHRLIFDLDRQTAWLMATMPEQVESVAETKKTGRLGDGAPMGVISTLIPEIKDSPNRLSSLHAVIPFAQTTKTPPSLTASSTLVCLCIDVFTRRPATLDTLTYPCIPPA
jgi:hypothetical protein